MIDNESLMHVARASYKISPQLQVSINTETGEVIGNWVYLPNTWKHKDPIKTIGVLTKAVTEKELLEMIEKESN